MATKIIKNGRRMLYFKCKKCGCEFLSDEYYFICHIDNDTPSTAKIGMKCPSCYRECGTRSYIDTIAKTDKFEGAVMEKAVETTLYDEEGRPFRTLLKSKGELYPGEFDAKNDEGDLV